VERDEAVYCIVKSAESIVDGCGIQLNDLAISQLCGSVSIDDTSLAFPFESCDNSRMFLPSGYRNGFTDTIIKIK
jgi:hypothetical protein